MLADILNILSILGIILLVLLGILIVALLLVLFMPIVYRINVEKEPDVLNIIAKMQWLFGVVRGSFFYPEPGRVIVKVLWITVFDSGKENPIESKQSAPTVSKEPESVTNKPPDDAEKTTSDTTTSAENESYDEADSVVNSDKKKSLSEKLFAKYEKIKYTIGQIYDKIKLVLDNITFYKKLLQDEETKLLLSHACKRLGKILQNIRPRKLKADVVFGTGSPDTTGYAYGVYGIFSPKLGKDVFVTPDFTQKKLEGRLYAAGHITIFTLLVNLLAVLSDKRLHLLKQRLDAHNRKSKKKI